MAEFKFFQDADATLAYIDAELAETLRDDMAAADATVAEELKNKIHDIEAVSLLVRNANDMRQALKKLVENFDHYTGETQDADEHNAMENAKNLISLVDLV